MGPGSAPGRQTGLREGWVGDEGPRGLATDSVNRRLHGRQPPRVRRAERALTAEGRPRGLWGPRAVVSLVCVCHTHRALLPGKLPH